MVRYGVINLYKKGDLNGIECIVCTVANSNVMGLYEF